MIVNFSLKHHPSIRQILVRIGWEEHHIVAAEQAAATHWLQADYGAFVALDAQRVVGFVAAQHYVWNRLAQIHTLAVDPNWQRRGLARYLIDGVGLFARAKGARGLYVDTPITNAGARSFYARVGFQLGYVMPRFYDDALDGVTYQLFFDMGLAP